MKKAFTLIELIVSVSLLMLMSLFLYQMYDISLHSNQQFDERVDKKVAFSNIKQVIIEDILEGRVLELSSNGENTLLLLQTKKSYHDSFFTYVTYVVSKENNLLRIESYKPFDINKLDDDFFQNAYVDVLVSDIKMFKMQALKDNNKAYTIILEKISGELDIFTALQLLES